MVQRGVQKSDRPVMGKNCNLEPGVWARKQIGHSRDGEDGRRGWVISIRKRGSGDVTPEGGEGNVERPKESKRKRGILDPTVITVMSRLLPIITGGKEGRKKLGTLRS